MLCTWAKVLGVRRKFVEAVLAACAVTPAFARMTSSAAALGLSVVALRCHFEGSGATA